MTNSWDLRGKFWILPSSLIDCTVSEHAFYARARMLNLEIDQAHIKIPLDTIFSPLNRSEADSYRPCVAEGVVDFLTHGDRVDPRVYAIREYGWIRTVENKFYAWDWLAKEFSQVRDSDFWKQQKTVTADSWVELYSVKSGHMQSGRVRDLGIMP